MARVIDYAWGRPSIASLKAAGAVAVCRYLAYLPNGKVLSREEAVGLRAGGIDIVSNWEQAGNWIEYSQGFAKGVAHATEAAKQHLDCGGPPGRPIYFSTDFNPTSAQLPTIANYYRGVASVISLARTGAYGGYATIKYLFDAGVIGWGWQTFAWSAGQWDSRAQLRQVQNGVPIGGVDSDLNDSMALDYGQWGASIMDETLRTATMGDHWGAAVVRHQDTATVVFPDGSTKTVDNINKQVLIAIGTKLDSLTAKIEALSLGTGGMSEPQMDLLATKLAAKLVGSPANALTTADHATIIADLKQALREGSG